MRTTIEISSPTIEPITTEQAKSWLSVGNINGSFNETELDALIVSARLAVEKRTEKPVIIREFQTTYDRCTNSNLYSLCSDFTIELPKQPIVTIESVKYFDEDNVEQTVSSSDYYFDSKKIIFTDVSFTSMRNYKSFSVNYTAGFSSTQAGVPQDIKTALKYYVSDFYNMQIAYRGSNAGMSEVKIDNAIAERADSILSDYRDSSFFLDGEPA